MAGSELESLLQSVAWQSSTLKQYFENISREKAAVEPEVFEILSDEDILALTMESGQGPAKRLRVDDVLPGQAERVPAAIASFGSGLKKSVSLNNFDYLSINEFDDKSEAEAYYDMSHIENSWVRWPSRDMCLGRHRIELELQGRCRADLVVAGPECDEHGRT
jgi:hypothetical protein